MRTLLAAALGLLHPILWAKGWTVYEWLTNFSRVPGPSTAIGGPGAKDREVLRHLQGWNIR